MPLVSIGELKAGVFQGKEEAAQCAALLTEAAGRLESACAILASTLVGSYDDQAQWAWQTLSTNRETIAELLGVAAVAMEEADAYVADADKPSAGGAGPLPPSAAPVVGGRIGAGTIRRVWRFAVTGFGNRNTALIHLGDHGRDFGARTVEEYVASAAEFLHRAQREDLPARVSKSGRIRIYDPGSNVFGSFEPDGTLVTYYKPGRGYWDRNKEKWGDEVFWD